MTVELLYVIQSASVTQDPVSVTQDWRRPISAMERFDSSQAIQHCAVSFVRHWKLPQAVQQQQQCLVSIATPWTGPGPRSETKNAATQ